MVNIYIPFGFFREEIEQIKNELPECNFLFEKDDIEKADIIWGNIPPTLLSNCKNLKWLQALTAGTDAYNENNFPKNAVLTNSTGAYTLSISEYILSVHLSLYRNLHLYRDNQNKKIWKSAGAVKSIKGSVVLIFGMGSIGTAYAKLVKSLGAYVIGVRRKDLTKPDFVDEICLSEDLEKVLPKADMLVICSPSTKKTKGLFNKNIFDKMKNGSMLINIGRGNIVNTMDMCEALENRKLSAVALDVVDPEPLPSDHKLWEMENVLITPHTSGGYGIMEIDEIMVDIFRKNLNNFLQNKPLINEVDLKEGCKKN